MLKAKDLVNQTEEELKNLYEDLCQGIFTLANELSVSRKLEKPHLLRQKKRERARVLTVLRQKEKSQQADQHHGS